jgi:Zn-finger nucleic acid-binding protein
MAEVIDLACARCGATLPPSAARVATTCPFCGATAAPVPKVVERVVERIVVAAPPVAEGGAFRCPRCAAALREAHEGDTSLHGCPTCGGVWIDRENLARLGNDDRRADALARKIVGPIAMGRLLGTAPDEKAEISCPICAKPMRRQKIQFTSTSVDLCEEHGTWLDWGELSVFLRPPTEDPARELTPEELDAAGLSGRSNEEGGFFSNLKRLFFGD